MQLAIPYSRTETVDRKMRDIRYEGQIKKKKNKKPRTKE